MQPSHDPDKKKRSKVTIRAMEFDDLAAVFHLGERLFTSQDAPNLYRTWDEYEVINLFREDQDSCLVAEQDKRVVGFALATTVSKPRSAWKYGYLVWLGVVPSTQRLGVATRLFHQMRGLMLKSGVRIVLVDTEADNEASQRFFQKAGFGNPVEHVYLTLNLAAEAKALGQTVEGGTGRNRRSQEDDDGG